jgi:flagellar biosynthesis protein FlhF
MLIKRFHGGTIAQAYEEVRAALGDDAIIVTTESTAGPNGGRGFEVVAAVDDGVTPGAGIPGLGNDAAAHDLVRALAEATAAAPREDTVPFVNPIAGSGRDRLRGAGAPMVEPAFTEAIDDATQQGEYELLGSIADRMRAVEETLQSMAHQRASVAAGDGPVTLSDLRHRLIDHGVSAGVLAPMMERLGTTVLANASPLQAARSAERALSAMLPPVPRLDVGVGQGPLAIFVVGPRGAGKTSFAIKLAHDLAESRIGRIILAGTDVGRAGAPQQLLAASAASRVEAHLCYTPGELHALLRDERPAAVIVDTATPAAGRREQMFELNAFAQSAPRRATLLTLPAWIGAMDAQRVTAQFAPLGVTGLVATQVDEAASFGGIVSAAVHASKGIAYTSASGGLTDGLALGDNHALALAVLTGAWPRVTVETQGSARVGIGA